MKIGIDIDDTITCTSELIIEYAKKHFNSDDDNFISDILRAKTIEGELLDFYNDYLIEMVGKYELKTDFKEVLEMLRAKGHRIIAITARGYTVDKGIIGATEEYFKRADVSFDKMIFRSVEKSLPCNENSVDLMIDDSISVLKEVSEKGIKTLLFTSINNNDADVNFDRANNWNEVFEYIENLV